MHTIAVLLTVHNRKSKTLDCLENVFKQILPEGFAVDVWLVDDGCTDGTPEAIREQFPEVHIIKGDGNLYWNRGMRLAWKTAAEHNDYDYYIWLNDDTYIYSNCISELLNTAAEYDKKAIIVGATCDTSSKKTLTYGGLIMKTFGKLTDRCLAIPDGTPKEVDFFNGNIVLIPKHVFKQVGNLDGFFSHSKGDFDYGLRAKKAGIRILQAGNILGECDEHASLDNWCNPSVPLSERLRLLNSPTGMPPKETFHLESRHFGFAIGAFHFLTIYVRCFFPKLWIKKQ